MYFLFRVEGLKAHIGKQTGTIQLDLEVIASTEHFKNS